MITKTYAEKLLDPRWQKKRLEVLNRDEFTCKRCYDNTNTLHVHHRLYQQNKNPWDYENNLLITLCSSCHKYETEISKQLPKSLFDFFTGAGFLPSDLYNIMERDIDINFSYGSEVVASIIGFFLKDKEAQKIVEKLFWKRLNNNTTPPLINK